MAQVHFGNAVLKRFLETDIKEIRIFSRDEKKQDDMRKKYQSSKLKFYIGDVRDYNSVLNATRGVDYIYHAAALNKFHLANSIQWKQLKPMYWVQKMF